MTKPLGVWVSAELLGKLIAGNQMMLHHLCSLVEAEEAGTTLRTAWQDARRTIADLQKVVSDAQHRQYVMREADRRSRLHCCDVGECSHKSCCVVDQFCSHPANGPRSECPPCECYSCGDPVCYACSVVVIDKARKGRRTRVCHHCLGQDRAGGQYLYLAHEYYQAGQVEAARKLVAQVSSDARYSEAPGYLEMEPPEHFGPIDQLLMMTPRNKAISGHKYMQSCKMKSQKDKGSYCDAGHSRCAAWDMGPCYRRLLDRQEDWERFGAAGLGERR